MKDLSILTYFYTFLVQKINQWSDVSKSIVPYEMAESVGIWSKMQVTVPVLQVGQCNVCFNERV